MVFPGGEIFFEVVIGFGQQSKWVASNDSNSCAKMVDILNFG